MNKQEVMAKVALTEKDTGSPEVQVALLTDLQKKDIERYRALIATLGLRK